MSPHKSVASSLPTTFWIDIGLVCLGLVLLLLTLDYPRMASTFPRLVLIMIVAVTIMDMVTSARPKRKGAAVAADAGGSHRASQKTPWKVFYLAALMFVFFILMQFLGVVLGTFVFILLSGRTLGYRKKRILFISSVIITASVYIIFELIMKSYLPEGYLFSWIGG